MPKPKALAYSGCCAFPHLCSDSIRYDGRGRRRTAVARAGNQKSHERTYQVIENKRRLLGDPTKLLKKTDLFKVTNQVDENKPLSCVGRTKAAEREQGKSAEFAKPRAGVKGKTIAKMKVQPTISLKTKERISDPTIFVKAK